jgi:plasmid stabilization system protein ParE
VNVRLKPAAEADVKAIQSWYQEHSPGRAGAFRDALDECVSIIAETPRAYPQVYGAFRRALLHRYPYVVFYLIEDDQVVVFGIFDGRRDPKMWESRLDT